MEFLPIFTKAEDCNLWSAHYPEDEKDVFKILFDKWADTSFLFEFFTNNEERLAFWGISVDDAIERVLDEAQHFNDELWAIETGHKGYEQLTMKDVFFPLHDNIYSLNWENEAHRKGKPDESKFKKPMLRIYAIELEDGCMVVTGGAIKLEKEMDDVEKEKLTKVQKYLEEQKINSRQGLID